MEMYKVSQSELYRNEWRGRERYRQYLSSRRRSLSLCLYLFSASFVPLWCIKRISIRASAIYMEMKREIIFFTGAPPEARMRCIRRYFQVIPRAYTRVIDYALDA